MSEPTKEEQEQAQEAYKTIVIDSGYPIGMDAYANQHVEVADPRVGDWWSKAKSVEPPIAPDIEVRCEACGELSGECTCGKWWFGIAAFIGVLLAGAMIVGLIMSIKK